MKKFGLFLMVLAVVALSVATSQAALLVEYNFEGNGNATAGLPVTAAATVAVGNFAGAGKIGTSSASLTSTNGSYVNVQVPTGGDTFPADTNGLWAGSLSFWVNGASYNTSGNLFTFRNASVNMGMNAGANTNGSHMVFYNIAGWGFNASADTTPLMNSTWHLVTGTWSMGTGTAGTGSYKLYIDGAQVASRANLGTATSASVFTSAPTTALGVDVDGAGVPKSNASEPGLYDDYAAWNNILSGTEVMTLANLGNSALNYGAADAQKLFDLFAAGSGTASVGGQTWAPATGLSGAAATVGSDFVVLDGSGGGVQVVPEPGTLSLLLAGAIGLLVFAWRKRTWQRHVS